MTETVVALTCEKDSRELAQDAKQDQEHTTESAGRSVGTACDGDDTVILCERLSWGGSCVQSDEVPERRSIVA